MIWVILAVGSGVGLGYVWGHGLGYRRGLRCACEILKDQQGAGQSAREWLEDLEREGTRGL